MTTPPLVPTTSVETVPAAEAMVVPIAPPIAEIPEIAAEVNCFEVCSWLIIAELIVEKVT